MKPGSHDIVRRTQKFWSGKLGRAVSEKEAAEMVLTATQFLDLLKSAQKRRNCTDLLEDKEVGCDQTQ